MTERDDDEKSPTHDPDRAAILERRKRFIALALTGLSTAACDRGGPNPPKPDACLKTMPRQEKADDDGGPPPQPCLSMPQPQPQPEPEVPPQPCLKMVAPEPDPQPQVCLKMAAPPDDEGEADAGEPAPAPRPCLKKAAPKPCLNMAKPG